MNFLALIFLAVSFGLFWTERHMVSKWNQSAIFSAYLAFAVMLIFGVRT